MVSRVSDVATQKAKAFRPMFTRSRKTGNQSTVGKRKVVRLLRPPGSASHEVSRSLLSVDKDGPTMSRGLGRKANSLP